MASKQNSLPMVSSLGQEKTERMRILYLITQADRAGAQMHLLHLARALAERHLVHVAVGEEGFLTESLRRYGIEVHILPSLRRSTNVLSDLRASWETWKLIKKLSPDLVHVHTFKAGFIGRFVAWWLGVPAVYTIHAWLWGTSAVSGWSSRFALPLERIAAHWCDQIIAVSHAGERLIRKHGIVSGSKVVTIHNCIEDRPAAHVLKTNQQPVLAMVARFTAGKDFALLLRAFAPLAGRARLVLVGDGETRPAMEALAAQLKIEQSVTFLGERDDVEAVLAEVDVFVLASESEMFPISILEAMRAEVPVIASDVGGIREAVSPGKTGVLVPAGDIAALTQAIEDAIERRLYWQGMGKRGREAFEMQFKISEMADRIQVLYLKVLHERRAKGISPVLPDHIPNPSDK
jgi:glycosyltransferase involved in cell wall biosynthesis